MAVIVIATLIVLLGLGVAWGTGAFQSVTPAGGVSTDVETCGVPTGILTVNELSAISGGTAPSSATITAGVNGGAVATSVTSGTTTFPVGATVEVLVSDTDSIDKSFSFVMPCGGKSLDAKLYYSTSDNPTIEWQDKNANTLTDDVAGGAANISSLSAGGSMKAKLILTGSALESSGDGIIVLEFPAVSDANITQNGVQLGDLKQVPVPRVYTVQNSASRVVAFEVPAVIGNQESSYVLQVSLEASLDVTGGVYTDWFSMQEFIDDDPTVISTGVEDSDGTAKYENTIDSDFYINA